jgi:hypothetical protein
LCIQHITPPSIKAEQIGENKQETEEKQNIFLKLPVVTCESHYTTTQVAPEEALAVVVA